MRGRGRCAAGRSRHRRWKEAEPQSRRRNGIQQRFVGIAGITADNQGKGKGRWSCPVARLRGCSRPAPGLSQPGGFFTPQPGPSQAPGPPVPPALFAPPLFGPIPNSGAGGRGPLRAASLRDRELNFSFPACIPILGIKIKPAAAECCSQTASAGPERGSFPEPPPRFSPYPLQRGPEQDPPSPRGRAPLLPGLGAR